MSYNRTLWVGNLSDAVDEEILIELFCHAGPIESVSRKPTKQGQLPPYAFVTFQHDESVHYAMALMEGTELFGRALAIKLRHGCEPDVKYQAMLQEYFLKNSSGGRSRNQVSRSNSYSGSNNRRHSDEGLVRHHSQSSFDRGYGGSPSPMRKSFQQLSQMVDNNVYDMQQDIMLQQQLIMEQQMQQNMDLQMQQNMGLQMQQNMAMQMQNMNSQMMGSSGSRNGGHSNRRSFGDGDRNDYGERDRKRHRGDGRDRSRGRYSDDGGQWDSRRRNY